MNYALAAVAIKFIRRIEMYNQRENKCYKIRNAALQDLDDIAALESICFPKKEAASRESFENRLQVFADYFWLLEQRENNAEDGKLVSMVNGMLTDATDLVDEMYENSNMHTEDGKWFMIFGVETRPEYQKKGLAGLLLKHVIEEIRKKDKSGIVLTCKEELLKFYEKFGFKNEGISRSTHGDVVWYQMRLKF